MICCMIEMIIFNINAILEINNTIARGENLKSRNSDQLVQESISLNLSSNNCILEITKEDGSEVFTSESSTSSLDASVSVELRACLMAVFSSHLHWASSARLFMISGRVFPAQRGTVLEIVLKWQETPYYRVFLTCNLRSFRFNFSRRNGVFLLILLFSSQVSVLVS